MKKKIIIISIALFFIIGIVLFFVLFKKDTLSYDRKIDAISYKMNLYLDINTKSLKEVVTMEIKNNTSNSINELVLRDMTKEIHKYNKENYNNETQSSNIFSIKVGNKDLKYEQNDSVIKVKLENNLKPNDTIYLTLDMKTDIPDRQDRFGYVKRDDFYTYALSFCFPYLSDNIDGKWITNPYFDDGESRSFDLANYEIELHHPSDYVVASTGKEQTNGNVTNIKAQNVRDIAIVVSNMMKKDSYEVNDIIVNNYYLDSKYTDIYRKLTELIIKDSIKVYSENVGKYPYDELDITPMLFGFGYGGMEYPGLIMTNATSFYDGTMMDAWSLYDGLSHEIAHEWFYATVGNDEYNEGWIDEGFTTYLERHIFGLYDSNAHKYLIEIDDMAPSIESNKESIDEVLNNSREYYKNIYLNISPDNYSEEQSYGESEYEASYAFLEELRTKMGDNKFSEFLKDFYNKYYLKVASTNDVLNLIRKHDNSKDVNEVIEFYFK